MKTKNGFYDIFVRSSAKYPSKVAVRFYDDVEETFICYTYSEMYGVSEYIAQQLRQLNCNKGVIGLISSINMIVPCVVAAAHKCSTSFIFLDPNSDLEISLSEVECTCLISIMKLNASNAENAENLEKEPDKVITIFGMRISFYDITPLQARPCHTLKKLSQCHSFITMTSGSTGEPKRIEVPVQCILPNITDLTTLFNITFEDVIYFSTPLTFDPSMVEILLAWMNGASLLIAPGRTETLFPKDKQHSVTVWQTTPSKFFLFSSAHIKRQILGANSPLKILALGGEPLLGVQRLKELKHPNNKTRLFALYGVSEMSCWACVAELDLNKIQHDHEVPLGKVLSETEIKIQTDSSNKSKNKQGFGKIILASKTRQCYLINKSASGKKGVSLKFVNTGDLGEKGKGGSIYYRGRRDDIVKRFGYKINIRLIESTCMLCPRVQACACIWLPKPQLLVLYYCSERLSSQDMSDFLKCKLDDRHWPDKIIRLDSIPINKHGKISKAELTKLLDKEETALLTTNSLKVKFLQELRSVLNSRVSYDDIKDKKFLAIGGSSFLAVMLCNNISQKYPEFGRFLLPHLLTPQRSIDEIINMADQEVCIKVKSKKRLNNTESIESTKTKSTSTKTSSTSKKSRPRRTRSVTNPIEFVEMWTYNSGKCVDATPSLIEIGVNLYVTVGSHSGVVVVLDGLSGTIVGEIKVKSRVEAAVCCHKGWAYVPACGVVGTYNGTVLCFTIETCEKQWITNIGSMIKSKAVCSQGYTYVASYDGFIRKLDLLTGEVVSAISVCDHQPISADLALAKNVYIIAGSLSGVCASYHTATDTLAWRCNVPCPIFAAPVVYADDKYAIFTQVNGEMQCITVEKGITIWRYSAINGNVFSSILVREVNPQTHQLVFGCYDKQLYSILVKNFQPSLDWTVPLTAPIYATPCRLSDKLLLAASNDGKLHIVTTEEGVIAAQYSLPNQAFSSPAAYGDYIFIGCRDDLVYSFRYVEKV